MTDRPTYIVHLRPEVHCSDPIRALRAVLKRALRDHGMRCVTIQTTIHGHPQGFYAQYLRQLGEQRRATGEPERETFDEAYWQERRRNLGTTTTTVSTSP
jgi:hypothetical protein